MTFNQKPRFKVKESSFFEYTRKNDSPDPTSSLQDILCLLDLKNHDAAQQRQILNDKPYLRFYTDQKGALKLFYEEIDEQVNQQTNLTNAVILAAASSSLNRLKHLADECNVTIELLEALISKEELADCSTKAKELENSKNYLRAAAYYFSCFDSKAGIRCLIEAQHFRDAVMAAKLRLSPTDSTLIDATHAWAAKFIAENCFEAAAKCYMSINMPLVASEIVLKRQTLPAIRASLRLALLAGGSNPENQVLVAQLARPCLFKALCEQEWSTVSEIIGLCPEYELWRYLSNMHQAICFILSQNNTAINKPLLKIELKRFSSAIRHFTQEHFMRDIWNLWLDGGLDPNLDSALDIVIDYFRAERCRDSSMLSSDGKDLSKRLPYVAVEMSLGVLHLSRDPTAAEDFFNGACELLIPYKAAQKILRSVVSAPSLPDESINTAEEGANVTPSAAEIDLNAMQINDIEENCRPNTSELELDDEQLSNSRSLSQNEAVASN